MDDDRESPLRDLRREVPPPGSLKARVTGSLSAGGFLLPAGGRRWIWAIAAGVAVFVSGIGVGRLHLGRGTSQEGQRYAILLYDPAGFDRSIPEANLVAEYRDWARGLGDRLSLGEKLGSDERLLRQEDSERRPGSVDGAAGPLGGLFIVRAGSWEEAMTIARSCPHLRHGGVIAVRAIEAT